MDAREEIALQLTLKHFSLNHSLDVKVGGNKNIALAETMAEFYNTIYENILQDTNVVD